jgi:CHAT domain-containing protein
MRPIFLWLRTPLLAGWLATAALLNLYAQPAGVAKSSPKGIALAQEARQAYRANNLLQAFMLAERATPLLHFGDEPYVWCMVLRMHISLQLLRQAAVPSRRSGPQGIGRVEAQFLLDATPETAKKLLYSYIESSHEAASRGSVLFSVGWLSTAFCLANRYDPAWQPVVQYKLFGGLEGLGNQVVTPGEADLPAEAKAVKRREREAVYANFNQMGISTGRGMLSRAAADSKPANWQKAYKRAVAIYGSNSPEVAIMLKTISNLYQTYGDTKTATTKLRESIALLRQLPRPDSAKLLACHMDMALLSLQTKQYPALTEAVTQAYPLLIRQNQQNMSKGISGRRKEMYALLNNDLRSLVAYAACAPPNQPEQALSAIAYDAMLYLNGLLLDDSRQMRATLHEQLTQTNDPALRQRHTDWLAKREAFQNGNESAREQLGEDVATAEARLLNAMHPAPARARPALSWQQVQARLQPAEAAVSFVRFATVSGEGYRRFPVALPSPDTTTRPVEWLYGALVLRPGYAYPRFALLGSEQDLLALLDRAETPAGLYGNARGPGFKNKTYGDSLYRFVWKPLEAWLAGAESVYVTTEGLVSQLALAALPLPTATRTAPPRERYLSGRHHLKRVFSMRQVAQGIQPLHLDGQTTIALLGGIDYEPTGDTDTDLTEPTYLQTLIAERQVTRLNSLASTGPEVSAIGKLLPHYRLLKGKNATEAQCRQLLAKPPTLLHVATHGLYLRPRAGLDTTEALVYSDDALTRSGLALAGANQLWQYNKPIGAANDGLLTAYEIADLDLNRTRLAVLSACETGLGDVGLFASSEGLLGLQRGFRLAGVEKMIVSLWSVDDERTQQFMHTFYTALRAGSEAGEAFRQAQLALQTTDDPTHWAAFVLIE